MRFASVCPFSCLFSRHNHPRAHGYSTRWTTVEQTPLLGVKVKFAVKNAVWEESRTGPRTNLHRRAPAPIAHGQRADSAPSAPVRCQSWRDMRRTNTRRNTRTCPRYLSSSDTTLRPPYTPFTLTSLSSHVAGFTTHVGRQPREVEPHIRSTHMVEKGITTHAARTCGRRTWSSRSISTVSSAPLLSPTPAWTTIRSSGATWPPVPRRSAAPVRATTCEYGQFSLHYSTVQAGCMLYRCTRSHHRTGPYGSRLVPGLRGTRCHQLGVEYQCSHVLPPIIIDCFRSSQVPVLNQPCIVR